MTEIEAEIAARLEITFSQQGFATPSVADLKQASGVSLRTLYRYFPSKEAMVIGALNHRHARYVQWLSDGAPAQGCTDMVVHHFAQLARWMAEAAPHGCMSMSALAAFPDNADIQQAVQAHKLHIREHFIALHPQVGDALFLLHEGAASAWPILGEQATHSAQQAALALVASAQ